LLKPLETESLNELFEDIVHLSERKTREVLVIEDNELDSSQIVKILQDDHIHTTIASDGETALNKIEEKDYDCIILDYMLPDISGVDLTNKISDIKNSRTPAMCIRQRILPRVS
jgi:DNA-binding response OmpR family regulator